MFGKGAKRKLDEDEEGVEGKALAPGVTAVTPPEGLSKVSYTLQRQTIFNISLMKLYNHRPLSEPSLERRVLINNMLRRIQEELKQEGSLRPLLLPPSPPPDDPVDEGFREAPPSFGMLSMGAAATPLAQQPPVLSPAAPAAPHPSSPPVCPSVQSGPTALESCLTPASLLEEDGDASFCTSLPPTPPLSPPPPSPFLNQGSSRVPVTIPRDPFSSSLNDMEDLCPPSPIPRKVAAANNITTTTSPTFTPPSQLPPLPSNLYPTTVAHPTDCTRTEGTKEEVPVSLADSRGSEARLMMDSLLPPPTSGLVDINSSPSSSSSSSSSTSSGFLSDLALDDILFADIDTSMYDFDPCTTSAATTAAGSGLSKLSPLVTADDLLKSLASPYSGPAPQVTPNQPFKIDLTELDHIMEVLVGS